MSDAGDLLDPLDLIDTGGSLAPSNLLGLNAPEEAAEAAAAAKRDEISYLREKERIPRAFSEAALQEYARGYGFSMDDEGNVTSDGVDLIERARRNPLYDAIMATRQSGEESILRNAAATGGLRSGNVQDDLFSYSGQLEQDALLNAYQNELQGLQGLTALPTLAPQIANAIGQTGQIEAQGILGSGQTRQNLLGTIIQGGASLASGGLAGGYF